MLDRPSYYCCVDPASYSVIHKNKAVKLGGIGFAIFKALHEAGPDKKMLSKDLCDYIYAGTIDPSTLQTIHSSVYYANKQLKRLGLKIKGVNRRQNSFYQIVPLITKTIQGEVQHINGKRVASPEYRSWQMMKNRCLNTKAQDYRYYGGRGIKIDTSWLVFEGFLADMGRRPSAKFTLERRNVNGNYCKENCYWATRTTQSRNRTYVILSEKKAEEIRRLYKTGEYYQHEIANQFGISQTLVSLVTRNKNWIKGGADR